MVGRTRISSAPTTKTKKNQEGQSSNMKVVVRVRPLNSMESARSSESNIAIRVMDEHVLVFDPDDESEGIGFLPGRGRKRQHRVLSRRARDLRFIFDHVFDEKATNQMVFENTTKSIVDGVLNGYNCSVFAYGATGAGKTHTMIGSAQNPGVTFLTMMELYKRINECQNEKICDVAVSYLEVYNETIKDLLKPGQVLPLREDPNKGVCISGLTLHQPHNAEELLVMLEFGNSNRTQHPTDANASSSRSHAVFQVFVRQKDKIAGLKSDIKMAKMSLIDLAGSERATVTTNRGARFREGANINKSLLALGNCINALANNEGKELHIPYRNSKLTRLLKDSLGGNCRTVMIAAVSPSSLSFEDTHNTLKYADRAKNIKSTLVKNVLSVNLHVSRYAKIVEELRLEVSDLKSKLFRYESGEATPMKKMMASTYQEAEIQRLKSILHSVYSERVAIKRDLVDIEAAERDLMVKLYRKERNLERANLLCIDTNRLEMVSNKMERYQSSTKSKQKQIASRKEQINSRLNTNNEWLERVRNEMKSLNDGVLPQVLEVHIDSQQHALEKMELTQQCKHFKKYAQSQEKDAQNTERIMARLLSFMKTQYTLLKGTGLCTFNIVEEYDSLLHRVTGGREISWADQSIIETEGLNVSSLINFKAGTPTSKTPIRVLQPQEPFSVPTPRRAEPHNLSNTAAVDLTPRRVQNCNPSKPALAPEHCTTQNSLNNQYKIIQSPSCRSTSANPLSGSPFLQGLLFNNSIALSTKSPYPADTSPVLQPALNIIQSLTKPVVTTPAVSNIPSNSVSPVNLSSMSIQPLSMLTVNPAYAISSGSTSGLGNQPLSMVPPNPVQTPAYATSSVSGLCMQPLSIVPPNPVQTHAYATSSGSFSSMSMQPLSMVPPNPVQTPAYSTSSVPVGLTNPQGAQAHMSQPPPAPTLAWGASDNNLLITKNTQSGGNLFNSSHMNVKRALDVASNQTVSSITSSSSNLFTPLSFVCNTDTSAVISPHSKIMKLTNSQPQYCLPNGVSPSTLKLCGELGVKPLPATPSSLSTNQSSYLTSSQTYQPPNLLTSPATTRPKSTMSQLGVKPLREINTNQTTGEVKEITTKSQDKPLRKVPSYASLTVSATNKCKRKENSSMLPRRAASKENHHPRSSSVNAGFSNIGSKHHKKNGMHVAGLRKAMSYANIHDKSTNSRTFAPRSNNLISNMSGTRL